MGERFVYTEEVAGSIPAPPIPRRLAGLSSRMPGYTCREQPGHGRRESSMLWLIAGVVLLIIAIAGGAIIHPVLFALAIVALLIFFMGRGARTV